MNRTIVTPILILAGVGTTLALMAATNIFKPLMHFIHTGGITPFQAGLCVGFTFLGFGACYVLLNQLCSYFVPRIEEGTAPLPANQNEKSK